MGEVAKKAAAEVVADHEVVLRPRPYFATPIPGLDKTNLLKLFKLKFFGIGCYPEGYNPRIHGAYHDMVYYGKADTKFCDLKLKDVPAWLSRRSYSPFAIWGGITRTFARYRHNWYYPIKTSPAYLLHLGLFGILFFYYCGNDVIHKTHRKAFYHW